MYYLLVLDDKMMPHEIQSKVNEHTDGRIYAEPVDDEEVRIILNVMNNVTPKDKEESDANNSFLASQAMCYIKDKYDTKLTLDAVANALYVSPCHLSKVLNKNIGKSFTDILNETRCFHAKEMLRNPAFRICDVSEMVGFSDVAHFSRVFKKMTGVSANEYRNKNLQPYCVEYVWKLKKMLDF